MITAVAVALSAVSALCALVAGVITSHHQKSVSKEANEIDRFEAIVVALERRVKVLEDELETVKRERWLALKYIRELITWARGPRSRPMPDPPAELEAEL